MINNNKQILCKLFMPLSLMIAFQVVQHDTINVAYLIKIQYSHA